jgi:hypothetical protein
MRRGARAIDGLVLVSLSAALSLVGACERPDPERDGFVLVDEEARAAGIQVAVSGEARSGALPVTVPEGAEALVVRDGAEEPLVVAPGELVEVVGPNGEIRRSEVPRDAIGVSGDRDAVLAFAEMIGARADRGSDGRWMIEGRDAFVLAALMGDVPGVSVGAPHSITDGTRRPPRDALDVSFVLQHPVRADAPVLEGPTPDPAALVGAYAHASVLLVLDAAGGYAVLSDGQDVAHGTFHVRPGGVDFVPADVGDRWTMELTGEQLVDDVGIDFAPVPPATLHPERPQHSLFD